MFILVALILFLLDTLVGAGIIESSSKALSMPELTASGLFFLALHIAVHSYPWKK